MAQIQAVETLRRAFQDSSLSPVRDGTQPTPNRNTDSASAPSQEVNSVSETPPPSTSSRDFGPSESVRSLQRDLQNSRSNSPPVSNSVQSNRDLETLEEGTELLNRMADALQREIDFEVIGSEGIVQARIKNPDTGEEIRSIPPDEVILVREKIDAFLGLFVDEFR